MDAVNLYNSFSSTELKDIGEEAYKEVAQQPSEGERKFLFAAAFLPHLIAYITTEALGGQLDKIADFYIQDYWYLHEKEEQ